MVLRVEINLLVSEIFLIPSDKYYQFSKEWKFVSKSQKQNQNVKKEWFNTLKIKKVIFLTCF